MLYLRYYGYELFARYIEYIDKYTEQKEGCIQVTYQRVRFNLKNSSKCHIIEMFMKEMEQQRARRNFLVSRRSSS